MATNPLGKPEKLSVALEGHGLTPDQTWELEVGPGATVRKEVRLTLLAKIPAGRHVFALRVTAAGMTDPGDAFVAVDREP